MKVAVVVLALLVVFLADRTVRLENQRYALYLGLCKRDPNPLNLEPFWKCLEDVQTRTSWFWHLYYAVTDHIPAVSLFQPSGLLQCALTGADTGLLCVNGREKFRASALWAILAQQQFLTRQNASVLAICSTGESGSSSKFIEEFRALMCKCDRMTVSCISAHCPPDLEAEVAASKLTE